MALASVSLSRETVGDPVTVVFRGSYIMEFRMAFGVFFLIELDVILPHTAEDIIAV